jgi:hypothetical protein
MHDSSEFSLSEFEQHITRRISNLSDIQVSRKVKVYFLCMWAHAEEVAIGLVLGSALAVSGGAKRRLAPSPTPFPGSGSATVGQ